MRLIREEKTFIREAVLLMLPMILQNFVTFSMSMADTFMVGVLGETALAAVTMANSPFYVMQLMIFGVQSGMSVLVAQYHGRGDQEAINRVMGIALFVSTTIIAVVVPVGLHKFSGHIRQLLTKTFAVNAIVFCQHRPDRLFQGFIDLPQVRVQGVSPQCRIRHIKDIVQARVSAGFIQQRNALGTTPDVTVHAPADKITVSLPIAILAVCRTENFCISNPD